MALVLMAAYTNAGRDPRDGVELSPHPDQLACLKRGMGESCRADLEGAPGYRVASTRPISRLASKELGA
jgi:hypothetical protein